MTILAQIGISKSIVAISLIVAIAISGIVSAGATTLFVAGPQGSKGETGDTGPAGPQGPKGDIGATGPAGSTGAAGSAGATGATGATGSKGDTGAAGANGATWLGGSGIPASSIGNNGDYYLDLVNHDIYNKVSGGWTKLFNIAAGANGALWFSGSGVPASNLGNNGDYYLNTANSDVYNKASGSWTAVTNIKGATGNTGATGATGANGATWKSGSGAPASILGNDGDFYLNTATSDVYNKASGTWTIIANIKGATGATGATGPKGDKGDTGATGASDYIMEKQYSDWTGALTGWTTIVSLTTPNLPAGYYNVELDAHSYQVYPSRLGIGIGVDSTTADTTTTRYWQCDGSPFVSGSTFLGDVHTQEVFYLTAGAHTFYLRAGRTAGTGDCELQNSHITVTFSPDGSVG